MGNINSFKDMDLKSQTDILFSEGKYLGVRTFYNYLINVHLLYGHLVEVWYCREKNSIERVEVNEDDRNREKYLEYVSRYNDTKKQSENITFEDVLATVGKN